MHFKTSLSSRWRILVSCLIQPTAKTKMFSLLTAAKNQQFFLGLTVNQVLNHAVISFLMFVFTPEQVKNHAFISQYMIFLWSCINAVDIMHQKGFGCNCSILLFSENQTEILFNLVRCERFSNPDFDDNFLWLRTYLSTVVHQRVYSACLTYI